MLEVAFQVANAADADTTRQIHKAPPNIIEGNSLPRAVLGQRPDSQEAAVYFVTYGLSHYLISRWLPAKWRPWFQGATTADTLRSVEINCDNGLCD